MKPFSFLKISAGLLALAALVVTSPAQAATPGDGFVAADIKILEVKGTATFNGKQLMVGDMLKEGSTVITGEKSSVKASFAESELNIIEDTTVVFEKIQFKKDAQGLNEHQTTLDLKKGGLIGDVKKLSKASNYEVKHAQGVAGIRGTKWAVLPGQGVICSEGSVLVTFVVNGVAIPPITLGPGQMVLPPAPGQPPIVINIPPALARFLTLVFGPEGPGPGPGPGPGGDRDIRIIFSPLTGDSGSEETDPLLELPPL